MRLIAEIVYWPTRNLWGEPLRCIQMRWVCAALLLAICGCKPNPTPVSAPAPAPSGDARPQETSPAPTRVQSSERPVRPPRSPDGKVSFNRDVAPLVFQACSPCHRKQGAAPFPLLTYDDVQSHAQQIVEITKRRYMPPWLPDVSRYAIRGNRRLSEDDIDLFATWLQQGTPRGAVEDLPPAPDWPDGWPLGPPDLVLTMPRPFVRKASSEDMWRNFAIPIPLDRPRNVQLIDFLPGNAPAIHHAVIGIDPTRNALVQDELDPEEGYAAFKDGVLATTAASGQFVGWLPGKVLDRDDFDQIMHVEPGSYLVLQLHMPPAGKDETIQSSIGLYFTDKSPQFLTESIYLSDREIDIPPDVDDYIVTQSYRFPIDIDVVRLFPHAHYLCKEMHITITRPGSPPEPLLTIPNWNFDWQDDYRFERPVQLPKGTEVSIRYRFDNTANNVRNPNQPPKRVVYGERSADEMGDLLLSFRMHSEADQKVFRSDYLRYQFQLSLHRHQAALARDPSNPREHVRVGEAFLLLGKPEEAAPHFQTSIDLDPNYAVGHARLASIFERQKKWDRAARELIEAIQLEPKNPDHRKQITNVLFQLGRHEDLVKQLEAYIEIRPDDAESLSQLGALLGRAGRMEDSLRHLSRAVQLQPTLASARLNLGTTLRKMGRHAEALPHLQEAVRLDPQNKTAAAILEETRRTIARQATQ